MGSDLFCGRNIQKVPEPREDIEKLHATIGKLKVENDFLERALSNSKNGSAGRWLCKIHKSVSKNNVNFYRFPNRPITIGL